MRAPSRALAPALFSALALALAACGAPPAPASSPASSPASPSASSPASAPASSAAAAGFLVDGAHAKKLVAQGARLVDVRTAGEFASGHIEGAENVPVDDVEGRDLGPRDAPLVLYCGSGRRASRAAAALRAKGYTRVYELGAMKSWDK